MASFKDSVRNKSQSVKRESFNQEEAKVNNLNKSQMVMRSPQQRLPLAQKFSALPASGELDASYLKNNSNRDLSAHSGSFRGKNAITPKAVVNLGDRIRKLDPREMALKSLKT